MQIPITKPQFEPNDLSRISDAFQRGWVGMGPYTTEFERVFSAYTGSHGSVSCSSGTTALHLALAAAGIQTGDEVIVPSFTWVASVNAILYLGAKPVLCDINLDTYALCPKAFANAITERTKAVLPVHLFGCAAPMNQILPLAYEHNIAVIEDAACALGTWIEDVHAGCIGDFGTFSFHPRKVITTGEGGMVTTNDQKHLQTLKALRNHGIDSDGAISALGFNYRLTDIQSAIGVGQMSMLSDMLEKRCLLANRYSTHLQGEGQLVTPITPAGTTHAYQAYVCRLLDSSASQRDLLMQMLGDQGIQTRPGTHAVHHLDWHRANVHFDPEQLTNASIAHETTIALPLYPGMTLDEQDYVLATLHETLQTL